MMADNILGRGNRKGGHCQKKGGALVALSQYLHAIFIGTCHPRRTLRVMIVHLGASAGAGPGSGCVCR